MSKVSVNGRYGEIRRTTKKDDSSPFIFKDIDIYVRL